jgi:ribonuclease Z
VLSQVTAGPYTLRGLSLGGVYTTIHVPELRAVLDVGLAPRSFAGERRLFLSHGHVDHAGALFTMLGCRALLKKSRPLQVFMPAEIVDKLARVLAAMSEIQRFELEIEPVGMAPGDEVQLHGNLWVRAFRTFHPVPSLGYQFFHRVDKLRPEFADLPGDEIGRRRRRGEDLFETLDRPELAYATDTLARVLEAQPELLRSRVLVLECTFLDERKSLADTHAGCHIHLDELLARADRFDNEHLVLMHFSQLYRPSEVRATLARRCPPELHARIVPFLPDGDAWPG